MSLWIIPLYPPEGIRVIKIKVVITEMRVTWLILTK
jgi:hypothetical protein